jgi:hypothetical protein
VTRSARTGGELARAIAIGSLAVLVANACSAASSHPYAARRFDPARGCIDRTTTIDVVEGPPAPDCRAVCLAGGALDGGPGLFVSLMCAPYPPAFDASGKDPRCAAAIAALDRGDTCLADGGTSNPPDAGAPPAKGAGADAASDSGEKDAAHE